MIYYCDTFEEFEECEAKCNLEDIIVLSTILVLESFDNHKIFISLPDVVDKEEE